MKRTLCLIGFLCAVCNVFAQELFPVGEPASNVPKGALATRIFSLGFKEAGIFRSLAGLRLMFGVTPKLSVYATTTFADYHSRTLPFGFISHHSGNPQNDTTATPKQGVVYPYVFNSVHLYAKYRLLTDDGEHRHARMAVYAEGSYVAVPAHTAEPDLLAHTSGFGAGIINTYLHHHFAASLTLGAIFPFAYKGSTFDKYGGEYPTTIQYGRGLTYNLSFGYLLFPRNYKSYSQLSWSVYCEFFGRYYDAAVVKEQYGPFSGAIVYTLPITTPVLKAGGYLDINPGLQCIINSTYRIDLSVALRLANQSYIHQYPMYLLAVQRYFYFSKHGKAKNN